MNVKKTSFFIFLISLNFLLFANEICLNKYGHITGTEPKSRAEFYIENGEYFIDIDGITLIGNSLFEIKNGYLTLTTIEENVPTTLRIYNLNGVEKYKEKFTKIINLIISTNKQYSVFYNGLNLIILNNLNYEKKKYPKSIIFDVNNFGEPVFVDNKNVLISKSKAYNLENIPRDVKIAGNNFLVVTSKNTILFDKNLNIIKIFEGNFITSQIIDNELYLVKKIRKNDNCSFILYKIDESNNLHLIERKNAKINSIRTHEEIPAPLNYGEENFPFPIGNSYCEIQQYGSPYLHPGVDFLGDDFQDVFAVHDGFVKAILTTGGDPYWRIAIANENISTETQGYLYAHLNENSIPYAVGDTINTGDLLGTLYPWFGYDFTHIHFARLQDSGSIWYGDWWTIDNPHIDVTNIQDTIPPVFENAIDDDLFAFRTDYGAYLDPQDLSGEFDIIAKCYDRANSDWKIDVWDLNYSLSQFANPDSILFEKFAFAFDMLDDTYISGEYDNMVLNTIYSRDETCFSIGDYENREYYHIITNSNGDSLITEDDESEIFDSTIFSDGVYWLKVTVRDASMNTTADSMMVMFNNENSADKKALENRFFLLNYPNPFRFSTTISFSLNPENTNNAEVIIYNIKGQKIRQLSIDNRQSSVVWDAENFSSGIYFYELKKDNERYINKMILKK